MIYPTQLTTNQDKFQYLSRVAELLRLEHNQRGADFRAGKITEKELKDYQKDFKGRLKNVLYEINKIKEAEGITRVVDIDAEPTEKQTEYQQLRKNGKTERKWDSEIDIKTIEKAGRGIKIFDPLEDYTDYTEVDQSDDITVAANKITIDTMNSSQVKSYVYYDKGVDHFDGDFEHLVAFRVTATAQYQPLVSWYMANDIGDVRSNDDAGKSLYYLLYFQYNNVPYIDLGEVESGTSYTDYNTTIFELDTTYYNTIERDESVGTYGTIYAYIYDDSDRTNLLDTLSVTLHVSKKDFRYIYGTSSYYYGSNTGTVTGYVENLDLQEEEATTTSSSSSSTTSESTSTTSESTSSSSVSETTSSTSITELPADKTYSKGDYANLPADDTNLENAYTYDDYDKVSADDGNRVEQCATDQHTIHQFKNQGDANDKTITLNCDLQSSVAPSQSTVYLQIYNRTLTQWETIDSDNVADANTDFVLSGSQTENLADYYDVGFWVSCRVYQMAQ